MSQANNPVGTDEKTERSYNIALALASLRRSVKKYDRVAIQTACILLAKELRRYPFSDEDDLWMIESTVNFVSSQVVYDVTDRMRGLVLPLVDAIYAQVEWACE